MECERKIFVFRYIKLNVYIFILSYIIANNIIFHFLVYNFKKAKLTARSAIQKNRNNMMKANQILVYSINQSSTCNNNQLYVGTPIITHKE